MSEYCKIQMSDKIATTGSKAQVFHGTAMKTVGGLRKADLMKNKSGRIVSIKKHQLGIAAYKRNKLTPKTKEELSSLRSQ